MCFFVFLITSSFYFFLLLLLLFSCYVSYLFNFRVLIHLIQTFYNQSVLYLYLYIFISVSIFFGLQIFFYFFNEHLLTLHYSCEHIFIFVLKFMIPNFFFTFVLQNNNLMCCWRTIMKIRKVYGFFWDCCNFFLLFLVDQHYYGFIMKHITKKRKIRKENEQMMA